MIDALAQRQTKSFIVPQEAAEYILLQRTQLKRFRRCAILRILRRLNLNIESPFIVRLEAACRARSIVRDYSNEIYSEFDHVRPFLPARVHRVLDIGCGIAGFDVCLYGHYASPVELYLLDRTVRRPRNIYYGFCDRGAYYSSLALAERTLTINGVPRERVNLLEATPDNDIPIDGTVDLVISFLAWGFHFPIEVYLTKVLGLLDSSATVVLDVNRRSEGMARLARNFESCEVILETKILERVVLKGPRRVMFDG